MISLVTGGAGFIGSHLCDILLSFGHNVICLDNFDNYYSPQIKRKNILKLLNNDNFILIEGSILNEKLLKSIILENSIDYIFNEAAQPGVSISVKYPMKPFETNIRGTLNVLNAALDSSVKKIINASSSSVYGKTYYLPYDEGHPTEPVSPYGVSKLAAEHYCRIYYELYGLKTTSLRYFTVYGPAGRPDMSPFRFIKWILDDSPVIIFGDGNQKRDFTYVDDIAKGT
ncbi:MAG: NAD-dependent epimerase/dehydratase family protein, partial [Nitrososphaeraceae archaeon]|nr:NAD-dependent epimerase/dehydratase family protein [Nitrososphaeraceae archaeon]